MPPKLDCLVVGAGPAGLTAAIYLARFHLSVGVFDTGKSRAALIPCTRNHAGFPGGISGDELLARMREQALEYGAHVIHQAVTRLDRTDDGFDACTHAGEFSARTVLIATGVTNLGPAMPEALHAQVLAEGRLRYCPVCDGFEVTDQKVAVIGTGARGLKEALFLRAYTRDVTLAPNDGAHTLDDAERRQAAEAGIRLIEAPAIDIRLGAEGIGFMAGGRLLQFESIYPALGSNIHSDLAGDVGADRTEEGCMCHSSMPQGTWWSALIRSATPWAKPASRRRPSATIWPRSRRSCAEYLDRQIPPAFDPAPARNHSDE